MKLFKLLIFLIDATYNCILNAKEGHFIIIILIERDIYL